MVSSSKVSLRRCHVLIDSFAVLAVNNDIRGLLDSVNDDSTSAFMWEWFTTKPFVDAGEGRFVSS